MLMLMLILLIYYILVYSTRIQRDTVRAVYKADHLQYVLVQ